MNGKLGLGSMLDSLEFVRKTWSQLNLPSALAPTMDPAEIDKRITDLRTVEQWLNANLAMLRTTIQGMEMQRDTLAAMHAFGDAVSASVQPPVGWPMGAAGTESGRATAGGAGIAAAGASASGRSGQASRSDPGPAGIQADMRDPEYATHRLSPEDFGLERGQDDDAAATGAVSGTARAQAGSAAPGGSPAGTGAEAGAAPLLDPSAWWNMLQQQFGQVAQSALSGVGQFAAAAAEVAEAAGRAAPATSPAGEHGSRAPRGKGATKSATKSAAKSPAKSAASTTVHARGGSRSGAATSSGGDKTPGEADKSSDAMGSSRGTRRAPRPPR